MHNPAEQFLIDHGYAIIDQPLVFTGDLPWYRSMPLRPLVPHGMEGDVEKMPALLRIDADAPWLPELARKTPRVISCLMSVPESCREDVLFSHLLNRIVVYAQKNVRYLMRFYDVRVFPHISRVLQPRQMVSLFGPIQRMTFIFDLQIVSRTPPELPPGELIPAFWQINDEQYERFDRGESLFEVMTWYEWEFNIKRWPNYTAYEETYTRIERAMECAIREYGLLDMDDMQRFAQHAMKYGEYFHLHPRIRDLIDALSPGKMPGSRKGYADAVQKLTETDWAHISAPLY